MAVAVPVPSDITEVVSWGRVGHRRPCLVGRCLASPDSHSLMFHFDCTNNPGFYLNIHLLEDVVVKVEGRCDLEAGDQYLASVNSAFSNVLVTVGTPIQNQDRYQVTQTETGHFRVDCLVHPEFWLEFKKTN